MPGITCDEANLPRQGFPEVYIPNGYVDIIKSDYVIKADLLHGDRMLGYKTNEVPDIDTEQDLKKLNLFESQKNAFVALQDYLSRVQRSKM